MPQINSEFENLKNGIIRKTDHTLNLEKVKHSFSFIINSRRKSSRIRSLNDLFCILEERDTLDCNNVSTLKYLGQLLGNEEIINLVHGYEKLYAEQEICVCGESRVFPIINPERENSVQNESNELQEAINNISLNIGKNWRVLASELCIPECYVDEVRDKYPDDIQKQALKILEVWMKHYGEKATLGVLKCKLESRLCKKKGLDLHMLKPSIRVE